MGVISKEELAAATQLDQFKAGLVAPILMRLLKLNQLNTLYDSGQGLEGVEFIDAILRQLGVTYVVSQEDLENIPATGSFITLANHPYGGLDGLLLLKILATARPDFMLMANQMLRKVTAIDKLLVSVNPFKQNNPQNIPGLRKTLSLLQEGRPLGIFPAGEVSNLHSNIATVTDPPWQPVIGRLITMAKVPVVPVYFGGSNSISFKILGLLHPLLQTARLPAELLNKEGAVVHVRIGRPVKPATLQALEKEEVLPFLRAKTYALGAALPKKSIVPEVFAGRRPKQKEIILETNPSLVQADLDNLPSQNKLVSHLQYEVFITAKKDAPAVMREIGRLRELTFRLLGEGTNQETDLDEFDEYYQHLVLYDRSAQKIAGAYRIGKGREILRERSREGFYLHTLFRMKKGFEPILDQSLEMGRSFVRPEYQKKPLPLLLLWKGIHIYLADKPEYHYLIGPVSISDEYTRLSKALIVSFITRHYFDKDLAQMVEPRKEFQYNPLHTSLDLLLHKNMSTLSSLDELITDIEPKRMGLPVLLKQYLKLNSRVLAFNIDPKFSNALDGLIVTDIKNVPDTTHAMLNRISRESIVEKV
jgi:putative hemolysin